MRNGWIWEWVEYRVVYIVLVEKISSMEVI